jgi:two-component system, NtrC family, sensor kinase
MHIEESATHQFEYETSPRCAQSLKEEQMQEPEALENCQKCNKKSLNSTSTETPSQIALADCDLGVWDWNLLANSFNFANFDPLYSLGESKIQTHLIFGYEPAEIPDYPTFERLIHPDDLLQVRQAWQDYLENRISICEVEFRILTKSAGWKWIRERGRIIKYDASGQPTHIIGTHRDITQEKFLYAVLHQHETREQLLKRVREIIDSSSPLESILQATVKEVRQFLDIDQVVIYSIFPNSDIVAADFRITSNGINNNQNLNCGKADLVTPILRCPWQPTLQVPRSGTKMASRSDSNEIPPVTDSTNSETNLWGMLIAHNCGGECKWEEWEIDTLKQVSRELGILIAKTQLIEQIQTEVDIGQVAKTQVQEISEQFERVQKQLLHNERLSNIGQLLSNLVTEIYNPVSFIHDTLHRVSQYAEDIIQLLESYQQHYNLPITAITCKLETLDLNFVKTDFLKMLWSMRAGSERLKETVFALHDFSHCDNGKMTKTDIHTGLNNALTILQHRLKEKPNKPGIQVIKKFGQIPLVNCFQSELNQVFMNLLTNAIEALEERMKYDYSFVPKISISTEIINSHLSLVSSNEKKFIDGQPIPTKQKIIIRISDNGTGILPHIKRRIFEAFFTTKPVGSKGLGLSISEEIIVQKHHGKLRCNSQLGEGTEFVIEINNAAKYYGNIRKPANF